MAARPPAPNREFPPDIAGLAARVRELELAMDAIVVDGTTALAHSSTTAGFYSTAPIAKQTGVAVTAGAVHAALVALGLIGA